MIQEWMPQLHFALNSFSFTIVMRLCREELESRTLSIHVTIHLDKTWTWMNGNKVQIKYLSHYSISGKSISTGASQTYIRHWNKLFSGCGVFFASKLQIDGNVCRQMRVNSHKLHSSCNRKSSSLPLYSKAIFGSKSAL